MFFQQFKAKVKKVALKTGTIVFLFS